MGLWKSFAGIYTVEITSASPTDALTAINKCGIALFDIVYIDALHVRGCVYRFDYDLLEQCLLRRGDEWSVVKKQGLYWTLGNLKRRPVLICGCLFFLFLVLYLPTRVLFVEVEGNRLVPDKLIIEKAESCGIGFWASRREVRSEKIKNALLSAVPQLQWAGVNTAGCVAVISVKERSEAATKANPYRVSSVVAAQDAVIDEITVRRGNAICKTGQAVKKGQVLVSAYTDCGILIKAETAEAEIRGKTLRRLDAISPANHTKRDEVINSTSKFYLRIGKNIINFCKDSGISGTHCAKMYNEKVLTLPGGFQLPLALVTESIYWYDCSLPLTSEPMDMQWMTQDAEMYLRHQMVAGKILETNVTVEQQGDVYRLYGQYFCQEEVGQIRGEEKINNNG